MDPTRTQYQSKDLPTSRALHVSVSSAEVMAMCAKHKCTISAIEALASGGTRVVMMNGDDAAVIRKAYGKKVLSGPVTRTRWLQT